MDELYLKRRSENCVLLQIGLKVFYDKILKLNRNITETQPGWFEINKQVNKLSFFESETKGK